jgi:hypothetical protein
MTLIILKKTVLKLTVLLISTFFFCACTSGGKNDRSTGRTNEILVVTNSKADWDGKVGRVIKDYFEQALPGLPQPESMFKLYNVGNKDFNKLFKAMHNILIVDINPSFSEPIVETRSDHWAKPQRLIKITAPDFESFQRAFEEHKTAFLKAFNELEIRRTNTQFEMARSVNLANRVNKKFGFKIDMPGGFVIGAQDDNFIWLRQSLHKVKQDVELGIFIHVEPYVDTLAFMPENILAKRDSLSSKNIPGPSAGSYMVLSRGYVEPTFIVRDDFVTGYAVETRGLWMVKNNFMGGPFISYTFVDPKGEKLFTIDGYVYNPSDLKRNFIRQLEAIFHTIDFNEE